MMILLPCERRGIALACVGLVAMLVLWGMR